MYFHTLRDENGRQVVGSGCDFFETDVPKLGISAQ